MIKETEQHRVKLALDDCRPLNDPCSHWLATANVLFIAAPVLLWLYAVALVLFGIVPAIDCSYLAFQSGAMVFGGLLWWLILRPLRKLSGSRKAIFLRAFSQDPIDDELRDAIRNSLPDGVTLSGIRPPAERTRMWKRFVFEPWAALRYVGSNYFELEADDKNWFARLLATLEGSHAIILDLRHLTPMVHHEVKLSLQCCRDPGRLYLIIDDSKDVEGWHQLLLDVGEMQPVAPTWILVPDEGRSSASHLEISVLRNQFADIPDQPFEITGEDLVFAETLVRKKDWKTSIWQTPMLVTVVSIVTGTILGAVSVIATVALLALTAILLFTALFLALFRVAKVVKARTGAGLRSTPSRWSVRLSFVLLGLPIAIPLLLLLLIPRATRTVEDRASVMRTRATIHYLRMVHESYYADYGANAWDEDEGVAGDGVRHFLLSRASAAPKLLREENYWDQPYQAIDDPIIDAWGTAIRATEEKDRPSLNWFSSAGPDKTFDTADDIEEGR